MVIVVDRREAGKTLAAVLKARLGWSWSRVKRLIERRHVRVGQQIETNIARRLKTGQHIRIADGIAPPATPRSKTSPGGTGCSVCSASGCSPANARPARHSAKPPLSARSTGHGSSRHLHLPVPDRQKGCSAAPPSDRTDKSTAPALEIVYLDDDIVVVNKPPGLTTMRHAYEAAEFGERGRRYLPATLADHLPAWIGVPSQRILAVHRLDRDTSGLVVFALNETAARCLSEQLRRHKMERRYWALTRGIPTSERLESWLVRDRGDGRRGSAPNASTPGAKRAITYIRILEKLGRYALVECRLETGRTHQVRIHLGEAGFPLCGERVYDRPLHGLPYPDDSGAQRPMLHAVRLGFVHPVSGEHLLWEAPPPEDFRHLLERLRQCSPPVEA